MKLWRDILVSAAAIVFIFGGTATAAGADVGNGSGTFGAGDSRTTYVAHGSPEINFILTIPSIHGKVTNAIDDTVVLDVGKKDGVMVGDKFRIERPIAVEDTDGDRAFNQAIGEIAITRVDDTGCAGMLLGEHPVRAGDLAVSTKRAPPDAAIPCDIPPTLAYADRIPVAPTNNRIPPSSSHSIPPTSIGFLPPTSSGNITPRDRSVYLPDVTPALSGDYLCDIPRSSLDIWAAGHAPLKVFIARADHVKGYRSVFADFAKQAFAEWTRASQNKLQFQYVDSIEQADIQVAWTWERSDLPRNELGITHTLRSEEGIEKAQVRLLTSCSERGSHLTDSAMWITTLHEIGHALGLAHSSNPHDVMTPCLSLDASGECKIHGLTARDTNSIAHLYGESDIHTELLRRHERAIASRTEPTPTMADVLKQ